MIRKATAPFWEGDLTGEVDFILLQLKGNVVAEVASLAVNLDPLLEVFLLWKQRKGKGRRVAGATKAILGKVTLIAH